MAGVIGGFTSIGFGVKAIGDAKKAAAKQRFIGRLNAALLQERAVDALVRGEQLTKQQQNKQRQVFSTQRAIQSAALLNPDFGSAALARASSAYFLAIDALNIRENAANEAASFVSQSIIAARGGEVAASATRSAGIGQAISQIGSGIASAASDFQTGGAFEGTFD